MDRHSRPSPNYDLILAPLWQLAYHVMNICTHNGDVTPVGRWGTQDTVLERLAIHNECVLASATKHGASSYQAISFVSILSLSFFGPGS